MIDACFSNSICERRNMCMPSSYLQEPVILQFCFINSLHMKIFILVAACLILHIDMTLLQSFEVYIVTWSNTTREALLCAGTYGLCLVYSCCVFPESIHYH